MKYPKPSNDLQHVLITAIRLGYVDCILVPFPGFRTRISELKLDHGLTFTPERVKLTNRFKRPAIITRHHLKAGAIKEARELYLKLAKNNLQK